MKEETKSIRNFMLKVRMNNSEILQLKKLQQASTEKTLSNYVRKVILNKPVIVNYRNQSADEFLQEMIGLKKQLNGIGNNFNQAVHKLHTLDRIPEFRNWIYDHQALQKLVASNIDNIRGRMNDLYEIWSRK